MDRMGLKVRGTIRAMGAEFSPVMIQETQALYGGLVLRPQPEHCTVERDLAYGPDPRHRLDLFRPVDGAAVGRPLLVFVHGGGFVGGDKGGPDAPFYNNVGAWAARQGALGVTITYRLAPGAPWPAGSEDVARAVAWLRDQAAALGGDPARITVMGQSAGAAHVAGYVADPRLHGDGPPIAGAVMISGVYDVASVRRGSFEEAYYGQDGVRFAEQSTLAGLVSTSIPCLYSLSEFDPPNFQQQAFALVRAHVTATGRWPRLLYLPDHNHLSSVLQIGSPVDTLGPDLKVFVMNSVEC
jgi:triacylglycerol lipase